jgi:hypothetical protein
MKKKIIIFLLFLTSLFIAFFTYSNSSILLSVFFKDCDYPKEVRDLQIESRPNIIQYLFTIDTYAKASFNLEKEHLKDWLLNSNFEVINYIPDKEKKRVFITQKKQIPKEILLVNIPFNFQFLNSNGVRTVFSINILSEKDVMVNITYSGT